MEKEFLPVILITAITLMEFLSTRKRINTTYRINNPEVVTIIIKNMN